jgi:hypothetical protein
MMGGMPRLPTRIVSGGQTGVDRAALDVALQIGIPCGGWCPRGRRAEDGAIPDSYPLRETPSTAYPQRTEWNVRDSDGTLILTRGRLTGGTALTVRLARRAGRPVLVVKLGRRPEPGEVAAWIGRQGIATLNVAGPREGDNPGIAAEAEDFLLRLLSEPGLSVRGSSRKRGDGFPSGSTEG